MAAGATLAPILNACYESFNPARVGVVLAFFLILHTLRCQKILLGREVVVYACFLGYMTLSVLWTPGPKLAINTLLPGLNFLLILMLFGSLVMFHNLRAVLTGMLFGFLFGAAVYTVTTRFPFALPEDFSYNAIAGMYMFGLFAVLLWGWHTRQRLVCLAMAAVTMSLIAATTSIKANLGVLLGAASAGVIYFTTFVRIIGRSAILLVVVIAAIGYAIVSNEALLERLQDGIDRVTIGAQVLGAREDTSQGTSFNDRKYWQKVGLAGWARNPVFGDGVEAFRADVGITSHSTPIDLLYNFGLIGFGLFYALFALLAWRLYVTRHLQLGSLPILILSGVVCYLFVSLSAPLHYGSFLAIFIGVTSTLLRRQWSRSRAAEAAS
jgi:O-antigen ligase